MRQKMSRRILLAAIVVVVLACFIVPFTLLRDVDAWYGSFLFWSLASVVVIAINWVLSADWKE